MALSILALYIAKLFVAAALCAAPANAAAGASLATVGASLPGYMVLCTPSGIRTLALDDSDADRAPGSHDGQIDCPICAASCKLPLLAAQLAEPHERPVVYMPAAWATASEASARRSVAAHFRSRAPPARAI